jgi:hypothetical protein
VIDLKEEESENALAPMHLNSESASNKVEESDLQYEKQPEQGI